MPTEKNRHLRQISGRYRTSSKFTGIKDREGNCLKEEDDVSRTCSEKIDALYDDPSRQQQLLCFEVALSGPEILKSEIAHAITKSKSGIAQSPDNVRVEMLKILNGTAFFIFTS